MVLPHICGFITSYMRINVLEQLESMDVNSICKVVCDGIYYKGEPVPMKNCLEMNPKISQGMRVVIVISQIQMFVHIQVMANPVNTI